MSFAICRMGKIKSMGNAGGLNNHIERKMDVPNADPALTHLNERLRGSGDLCQDIQTRIDESGCNVRSNAVIAIEFMLTASPEFFEEDRDKKIKLFKNRAGNWIQEKYGNNNLVNFTLHLDEKTPHIHAVVVPIDEKGKLNARAMFGGRDKLKEMQDSFADSMKDIGLVRGIKGSKAEHMELKTYYGLVQNLDHGIKVTEKSIKLDKPGLRDLGNINKWTENQTNKIQQYVTEIGTVYQQAHLNNSTTALERIINKKERRDTNKLIEEIKYKFTKDIEPEILAQNKENKELKEKVNSYASQYNTIVDKYNALNKKLKIYDTFLERNQRRFDEKTNTIVKDDINRDRGMKM